MDEIKKTETSISDFLKDKENQDIVEAVKPKQAKKRGRPAKQKAADNSESDNLMNQMMLSACCEISFALSIMISAVTKNKKWIADEEDKNLLGLSIKSYIDIRFPDILEKGAPELMLIGALTTYVSKRADDSTFDVTKWFRKGKKKNEQEKKD